MIFASTIIKFVLIDKQSANINLQFPIIVEKWSAIKLWNLKNYELNSDPSKRQANATTSVLKWNKKCKSDLDSIFLTILGGCLSSHYKWDSWKKTHSILKTHCKFFKLTNLFENVEWYLIDYVSQTCLRTPSDLWNVLIFFL